jgi:X-X-X-Leu-X-X-Gly heptad repeat protein
VRRLERQRGVRLSSTELLANSLGKLAAGVQRLATGLTPKAATEDEDRGSFSSSSSSSSRRRPGLMLFAGRRSSSRRYLLLQNW